MGGVAVLIPVLGRPHRVKPTIQAFTATTPVPFRLLFIASPGDTQERQALATHQADVLVAEGNYAQKLRAGIDATTEPLVFLGADDLDPYPGWLQAAQAHMTNGVQVVGVNDLIRRRHRPTHATHFLLTREAALMPCIDGTPGPLCTAYTHSAVDDELIATATKRAMYAYAPDSHVEHQHPMNGKAQDDETYRLGRLHYRRDLQLFRERSRLWA
jgi:hypothetical protein